MEKKYTALITSSGEEKIADAALNGNKVTFTQMAVGDSGGNLSMPEKRHEGLVNECYRSHLNSLQIVDSDKNIIEAEMIIPPNVGGFTMREIAIYDDSDTCIVIASMPETYKPLLEEGSGRVSVLRVWIAVSSTSSVELIADPGIIVATVEDVIKVGNETKDYTDEALSQHEQSTNHPDATLKGKGFTQLSSATNSDSEKLAATPKAIKAAIAAAVRQAWEISHPIGLSLFFFEKVNPNTLWSWSTWEYTGEGRTVRIAERDGSNVGKIGGSDTVTLARANLPAEKVNVSGKASETDLGTKRTKLGGKHVHHGVPQRNSNYELGGNNRVFFDPYAEGNTDESGEHDHEMELGPHSHPVSGETERLGQGQAISIVESHMFQMCWRRVK
ncbi:Phage tail fibre repeat [Serratia proteamaculans]|uniref:phage tail protein n=1 Tax=Serratia proteamaculans TaxID=28151 RepID=UPI00217BE249|nr:phage tail protein [Serratia proteamaculans]CAI0806611.1 Phage tail fibre repeat [Serratia proteamaculans]CAI1594325.1 Phage tail fibre repeat [Serratia proteamaculans]